MLGQITDTQLIMKELITTTNLVVALVTSVFVTNWTTVKTDVGKTNQVELQVATITEQRTITLQADTNASALLPALRVEQDCLPCRFVTNTVHPTNDWIYFVNPVVTNSMPVWTNPLPGWSGNVWTGM